MAIQKINLGTEPLGEGGDTYRSANTKINQNFSDNDNAASRLVGTAEGNVPEMTRFGVFGTGIGSKACLSITSTADSAEYYEVGSGFYYIHTSSKVANELERHKFAIKHSYSNRGSGFSLLAEPYVNEFYLQSAKSSPVSAPPEWYAPVRIYHTGNTTIGTNKQIVTSSPVVRVFNDKIEAIHEANDLPLEFIRNSEGDYTLKGTTGLRGGQNDWQIIIPKDDHDNQLIAFTLEDDNGTIRLKTYKRTFSMETFTFGPDLKTPLDIPEGRWVDLHFNDLPQEELDKPEPAEEPIEDEVEGPVTEPEAK